MKRILLFLLPFTLLCSCKQEVKEQSRTKETSPLNYTVRSYDSAVISSGSLQRITLASKYVEDRPVDVWLPSDYSSTNSYSVLYMHDGQMLFDSTTTWNKQEWKVDEWATELMREDKTQEFIVVGIHNIPEIRWFDLFPQKSWDYLDAADAERLIAQSRADSSYRDLNGDNYLKFIVEELKPIIDTEYAVYTDKAHTFIGGSSMGGLMSMYALSEYPDLFQGAACLSTHWVGAMPQVNNPLPKAIFSYMADHFPKAGEHLVYFDYGNETLDQFYPQFAPRVDSILADKGFTKTDSRNLFFEGTNHSENAWNKRLNYPFEFLLGQ